MILNREGFPAFRRSLEEQALQVLMTGTQQNTFYAGAHRLGVEAAETLAALGAQEAELLARMIVYAREQGCMRRLPTLGLAVLSQHPDAELFERVFPRVVRTPRELRDYLEICREGPVRRGFGRRVKRAVGRWILELSEYHLLKYRRDDLRDAVRLARPRTSTIRGGLLLRLLTRGLDSVPHEDLRCHMPQVAAWREFLATRDPRLVEEGRLPYEAVVAAVRPGPALWRLLMRQMPTMALLRHLVTLARSRAVSTPAEGEYLAGRIADPQAIRTARILPFRFLTAMETLRERWKEVRGYCGPTARGAAADYSLSELRETLLQALSRALDHSLENLLPLPGRVCIATDVSSSMSARLSERGRTRLVELAALFTAALVRAQGSDALILPFNHQVLPFAAEPGAAALETVQRLTALCDGGTRLSTRALAAELGVGRQTILAVYELLLTDGRARGHVGRGTFVA